MAALLLTSTLSSKQEVPMGSPFRCVTMCNLSAGKLVGVADILALA